MLDHRLHDSRQHGGEVVSARDRVYTLETYANIQQMAFDRFD